MTKQTNRIAAREAGQKLNKKQRAELDRRAFATQNLCRSWTVFEAGSAHLHLTAAERKMAQSTYEAAAQVGSWALAPEHNQGLDIAALVSAMDAGAQAIRARVAAAA